MTDPDKAAAMAEGIHDALAEMLANLRRCADLRAEMVEYLFDGHAIRGRVPPDSPAWESNGAFRPLTRTVGARRAHVGHAVEFRCWRWTIYQRQIRWWGGERWVEVATGEAPHVRAALKAADAAMEVAP